jgi:hypothetical protein
MFKFLKRKKMTKFKNGDKAKFLGCVAGRVSSNNRQVSKGDILTVMSYHCANNVQGYYISRDGCNNLGFVYDYELETCIVLKELIQKRIEELEAESTIEKAKLEYLESVGVEEYDEKEFKAYQVLKIMGIDDINKAKQVAKLFEKSCSC